MLAICLQSSLSGNTLDNFRVSSKKGAIHYLLVLLLPYNTPTNCIY